MKFTIDKLFKRVETTNLKHQSKVGLSVITSWRSKNDTDPPKIEEKGMMVFQYPKEFIPFFRS